MGEDVGLLKLKFRTASPAPQSHGPQKNSQQKVGHLGGKKRKKQTHQHRDFPICFTRWWELLLSISNHGLILNKDLGLKSLQLPFF